jgi:hypothetical protein
VTRKSKKFSRLLLSQERSPGHPAKMSADRSADRGAQCRPLDPPASTSHELLKRPVREPLTKRLWVTRKALLIQDHPRQAGGFKGQRPLHGVSRIWRARHQLTLGPWKPLMHELVETTIRSELDAGEQTLWAGWPRQGFVLRAVDVFLSIQPDVRWICKLVGSPGDRVGAAAVLCDPGIPFVLSDCTS